MVANFTSTPIHQESQAQGVAKLVIWIAVTTAVLGAMGGFLILFIVLRNRYRREEC